MLSESRIPTDKNKSLKIEVHAKSRSQTQHVNSAGLSSLNFHVSWSQFQLQGGESRGYRTQSAQEEVMHLGRSLARDGTLLINT